MKNDELQIKLNNGYFKDETERISQISIYNERLRIIKLIK